MSGLKAPFRGIGYLRKNKKLWLWVLPPALVNTLITVLSLIAAVALSWWLIATVWPMYGSSFMQWVYKISVSIGIVLGVIGLTVIVWLVLINVCAGYLLSILATRVEKKLGLSDDEIHEISLVREGIEAALETAVVLSIHLAAFLAQFIPFLGTVVSVPIVLVTDAFVFGWEILAYPMGVRGMTLKQRGAFIKRHRPEVVGLGSAVLPFVIVPVIGGFMMSFATVGAVLLYRDLIEADASLPLPPGRGPG